MILAVTMLNLVSCTKDENPPATTSSKGIVSFKVNGNEWNSNGYNDVLIVEGDSIFGVSASFENDVLSLSASRRSDTSGFGLELVLTPNRTGTYNGTSDISSNEIVMFTPKIKQTTIVSLLSTYTITYSVIITKLDLTNKLVSGVFTINQIDPSKTNPLGDFKITDGAFTDVKLVVN